VHCLNTLLLRYLRLCIVRAGTGRHAIYLAKAGNSTFAFMFKVWSGAFNSSHFPFSDAERFFFPGLVCWVPTPTSCCRARAQGQADPIGYIRRLPVLAARSLGGTPQLTTSGVRRIISSLAGSAYRLRGPRCELVYASLLE
jgi:hypothetical protein